MPGRPAGDERGQASLLIVGFAVVLAMMIAVVVNSSAAYLERQGLASLADGAALQAADLGVVGDHMYQGGVSAGALEVSAPSARAAVRAYLADTGAFDQFADLHFTVRVEQGRVLVHLSSLLDLPVRLPGAENRVIVESQGAAVASVNSGK